MADDFYCQQVLSGVLEVEKVEETDQVLAFVHTRPAYDTAHVVVVPKHHVDDLLDGDLEDTLLLEILRVARRVAADIVDRHGAARVITNLGRYQDSRHLHMHVVSGERISR